MKTRTASHRFNRAFHRHGLPAVIGLAVLYAAAADYPVVDTMQTVCCNTGTEIQRPAPGQPFAGQDAQYDGHAAGYTISADGLTVTDNVTGLVWQRSPDTDGNGRVDSGDKLTWNELQNHPATLNAQAFGGVTDWRLPTIKELYSLIDFRGTDPAPDSLSDSGLTPFIDAGVFEFAYGDTSAGERIIDSQWASSSLYVANQGLLFGVNFADGRIKGYELNGPMGEKTFFVLCVRNTGSYGVNQFVDNGDGTVTDLATGLTWQQADSGSGMDWEAALAYAESLELGGHTDWRLPNAKELQSIVDYTRSPDTTASAAIDPVFSCTAIVNLNGVTDYPYYWTGTTHMRADGNRAHAVYLAFGRGLGDMHGTVFDVHGAGCQRSDPKTGHPDDYPQSGFGPQGDVRRVFNHVRCVRGGGPTPWSGGMRISDEWKFLDWAGAFSDAGAPWIYHLQHGWLYSIGSGLAGFWSYSLDLATWIWTVDTLYPWMYFYDSATWMYYLKDSTEPRWFYNAARGRWETR